MAKRFQRVSSALAAGRAATKVPAASTIAEASGPKTKRYILALILGQTIQEARTTASTLAKIATEKQYGIILVTDQSDIDLFQIEDCITEYLPSVESLAGREDKGSIQTYLERRLNILMQKWEPIETVPFGEASEAIFDIWRELNQP